MENEKTGQVIFCSERDQCIVRLQLIQQKDPVFAWMPESQNVLPVETEDAVKSLFKRRCAEGKRKLHRPNKAAVLYENRLFHGEKKNDGFR